uniref:Putative secreted protein ovary overexpressed n=1 Tax=Rhipicephalus microplus TaxID=6941 RepID=A0A6M2DB74_RHIMP
MFCFFFFFFYLTLCVLMRIMSGFTLSISRNGSSMGNSGTSPHSLPEPLLARRSSYFGLHLMYALAPKRRRLMDSL